MESEDQSGGFDKRFAQKLYERHPEWRQYEMPRTPNRRGHDGIAIEVPSRFAPLYPLRIDTANDEITISWAGWHVQIGDWTEVRGEAQFTAEALEFIDELIAENRVVIINWKDGPGGAGGNCLASELDDVLKGSWWVSFVTRGEARVLSWNGTYDRWEFDPSKCQLG